MRDVRDIGAALVGDDGVRLLTVPLSGRPEVPGLVAWIQAAVAEHAVQVVSIDGPLGWKGVDTESVHCRLSERALRAPGKTGLPPDGVKPAGYLGFTRLSIALFEALTMSAGWRLPGDPRVEADGSAVVTECFPTAIWRGMALPPLMGKARATPADVVHAGARFTEATGLALDPRTTHDELQAVVAAYAGWCLAGQDPRAHLAGAPPYRLDGAWREGYILSIASPGGA